MNLNRFAALVIAREFALREAERPIDRKTIAASLQGMFEAADRLGLTPSPFALEMDLRDAIGEMPEPRPGFRPVNNPQKAWDADLAARLVAKMEAS